jgi:hypothetical protein
MRTHWRAQPRSLADDYILLLGALLVSADVAFAESQFQLLGDRWSLYLILLACVHAVTAYALDSRLVLSVALASLAGWFGIEQQLGDVFAQYRSWVTGGRALLCATLILGWRVANDRSRDKPHFNAVFEQYAINLGFWGGLTWCSSDALWWLGAAVVAALATVSIRKGLRTASETFVAYGVVYSAIGICIITARLLGGILLTSLVVLLCIIGVAMLLWKFHNQLRNQS